MSLLSIHSFSTMLLFIFVLFFYSLPLSTSSAVLYDVYPFVRVYTNGTIERFFGLDRVPPSTDPSTGVHSKDVTIQSNTNLSVRIFLPPNPTRKLPLLLYFHGGGFFSESAFSPTYHNHLNSLAAKAHVIAVSVNYRLAPEHPLPVAYEDSWAALKWTFSRNDAWLKQYADFGRVYLGGDSSGANIAHHMAIRVGKEKPDRGVNIIGMFLNCPYFWGKTRIGNESAFSYSATLGKVWTYAYPKSSGLDDPLVNPGVDSGLRNVGCKRVLVYTAGLDVLRYRALYYVEALKKSGWDGVVKVVEVPGEEHDFVVVTPTSSNSRAMVNALAYFLNH